MGITKENVDIIRQLCPDGTGLMMIDDVYSQGGTLGALQEFLYTIIHTDNNTIDRWVSPPEGQELPAAVVMREAEPEHGVMPEAPQWLRRVFDAPVLFVGHPSAA